MNTLQPPHLLRLLNPAPLLRGAAALMGTCLIIMSGLLLAIGLALASCRRSTSGAKSRPTNDKAQTETPLQPPTLRQAGRDRTGRALH